MNLLLVGLGGAFGAICRYLLGVQMGRNFGTAWPYGTLAVNVIGGLLMGILIGALAYRGGADQEKWRLLLLGIQFTWACGSCHEDPATRRAPPPLRAVPFKQRGAGVFSVHGRCRASSCASARCSD